MNILILTCRTGDGHNAAAYAMAEEFERRGWTYEVADPIGIRSKKASEAVCSWYNGIIRRTPKVFGAFYHAGRAVSSLPVKSPVYLANKSYAKRILYYVEKGGFDAVLSTHLFGMEALTALKRKHLLQVPTYGIMTDYTCIPFFAETELDEYYSPHPDLKGEMAAKGLPAQRIVSTGIPVSAKFHTSVTKAEAREALGMPRDKKIAVIMTGGVGCESMASLCKETVFLPVDNLEVYAFVGRNSKLQEHLRRTCPFVHTVPYTKQVHLYLRAADAVLTKAGGLSSTECAVSGTPLVHLKAIPGCETCNAKFFASRGMSMAASNDKQAAGYAKLFLTDPRKAEIMAAAQHAQINPHAARDIADRMVGA